jgi:hypothetical protein
MHPFLLGLPVLSKRISDPDHGHSPNMEGTAMITMFLIYAHDLQQGSSDSTKSNVMLLPLLPSCAQITIQDHCAQQPNPTPAKICSEYDRGMKNSPDLLLDFKKIFSHSNSQING